MRVWGMAQTSCVILRCGDRKRLAAIIVDRNRPHKHVQRARIILHSDERLPVLEVARRAGASRPAVWRWQQRFAEEGVEGLLRQHLLALVAQIPSSRFPCAYQIANGLMDL